MNLIKPLYSLQIHNSLSTIGANLLKWHDKIKANSIFLNALKNWSIARCVCSNCWSVAKPKANVWLSFPFHSSCSSFWRQGARRQADQKTISTVYHWSKSVPNVSIQSKPGFVWPGEKKKITFWKIDKDFKVVNLPFLCCYCRSSDKINHEK